MKKISYLIAMAFMAFTFTSCEDVPAPFGDPINPNENGGEPAAPVGTGTLSDPFNVAAAIAKCKEVGSAGTTENFYVKGKVASIKEAFSSQYGTGTFNISDDGSNNNTFTAYRILYLGNKKFTDGDTQIQVGDEVIIFGKIMNYGGNTPETVQNAAYLYALNGKTADGGSSDVTPGTASGDGTQASPFNVAAAVAKCQEVGQTASTESFYIKGIADTEYTVDNHKNVTINIVDVEGATEKFQVYRVKAADNKNIKEGYQIAKGAEIIIYGPVVNYKGNTPETATGAYLVSVNGQAPELDEAGSEQGGGEQTGGGEVLASLVNGNFEAWENGLPTGWKSASTASSATLTQSTDAHGGSYSVNVKGDASSNKRLASQEITLAAGEYTFSFWVKPTTTNTAQVRPGYVPVTDGKAGTYAYGDYATLAAGWQQVSYNFTLAAETTVCLVVMNPKKSSYSSGEDVLIDDATLTKK